MKISRKSSWYPFRSREVKDIYDHLTEEEFSRLHEEAKLAGGKIGRESAASKGWLFPAAFVLGLTLHLSMLSFGALTFALGVPGIVRAWRKSGPIRQKFRQMLCETAYARQKGYSPATLRMYRF